MRSASQPSVESVLFVTKRGERIEPRRALRRSDARGDRHDGEHIAGQLDDRTQGLEDDINDSVEEELGCGIRAIPEQRAIGEE